MFQYCIHLRSRAMGPKKSTNDTGQTVTQPFGVVMDRALGFSALDTKRLLFLRPTGFGNRAGARIQYSLISSNKLNFSKLFRPNLFGCEN